MAEPVEITWKDASEQWGTIDPAEPPTKTFRTAGLLINETPEYFTIVTHIDLETNEMHHRFDVLKSMVVEIKRLGGTNDKSRVARKNARPGRTKNRVKRT